MMREKLAFENPVGLLRMLKGCPLSVLFALAIARQPVGRSWLVRVTGYNSVNTVQQALEYLEEIGLATRSKYQQGWKLAGGANQLLLVFPNAEDGGEAVDGKNQNLILSSATTATYLHSRERGIEAAAEAKESIIDSLMDIEESIIDSFTPYQRWKRGRLLSALHDVGIMGRKAEVLAELPHVTERYIAHHALYAEKHSNRTGLLIKRMEDGDPEPRPHDPATCPICDERKYDPWGMEMFSDEENLRPEEETR